MAVPLLGSGWRVARQARRQELSGPSLRGPLPSEALQHTQCPHTSCFVGQHVESSDQAFAIFLENVLYLMNQEALGYWHADTENWSYKTKTNKKCTQLRGKKTISIQKSYGLLMHPITFTTGFPYKWEKQMLGKALVCVSSSCWRPFFF